MTQMYQAKNGETLIAQDEVQAAAFERAGLEPVDGNKPRKQKSE